MLFLAFLEIFHLMFSLTTLSLIYKINFIKTSAGEELLLPWEHMTMTKFKDQSLMRLTLLKTLLSKLLSRPRK